MRSSLVCLATNPRTLIGALAACLHVRRVFDLTAPFTRRKHAPILPREIILHILSLLTKSYSTRLILRSRATTGLACCRVARLFLPAGREVLYRVAYIESRFKHRLAEQLLQLHSTVSRNPRLSALVREVVVGGAYLNRSAATVLQRIFL